MQTGKISNERLENISTESGQISFRGFIQSPTPRHNVKHDLSESKDNYTLNIYLEESGQFYTQQVVMKGYKAEIEADQAYKLGIQHHGKIMKKLETIGQKSKQEKTERQSFLDKLTSFFKSLFKSINIEPPQTRMAKFMQLLLATRVASRTSSK